MKIASSKGVGSTVNAAQRFMFDDPGDVSMPHVIGSADDEDDDEVLSVHGLMVYETA